MAKIVNIKEAKEKKLIYNYFEKLEKTLNDPEVQEEFDELDAKRRAVELQWIEEYNIEDNDTSLVIKALDLLSNVILQIGRGVYTDKASDIVDILCEHTQKLAHSNLKGTDSPFLQKLIAFKNKPFKEEEVVQFYVDNFEEWKEEVKLGVLSNDEGLISNAFIFSLDFFTYTETASYYKQMRNKGLDVDNILKEAGF